MPRVVQGNCAMENIQTLRRPSAARAKYCGSAILAAAATLVGAVPATANNYGESSAWQFRTSADRANQAAIADLIEKRRGGYYAAPIYNMTIARQYNCSIAPVATANSSGQSATANSPSVTGATSSATGNANDSSTNAGRGGVAVDTRQANSGTIASGVLGSTNSVAGGTAWQALNSTQTNSGAQNASVEGSSACAFGTLN
jgi:hypothetical protein